MWQLPGLFLLHPEPIRLFPTIHSAYSFKLIPLREYHLIEGVFRIAHRIRSGVQGIVHLRCCTLSHSSQSGFDGIISRAVVDCFLPDDSGAFYCGILARDTSICKQRAMEGVEASPERRSHL